MLDISADLLLFDGVETVTYQRRDLSGSVTSHTGVKALKRAVVGGLVPAGQAQASSDLARWHVQASSLPVSPRRGDRIVSLTSGTWEVVSDDVETLATRYVCTCRKSP